MRTLKAIGIFISTLIFIYLVASFIEWDFNAGNWASEERAFTSVMAILIAGCLVGMYIEKSNP